MTQSEHMANLDAATENKINAAMRLIRAELVRAISLNPPMHTTHEAFGVISEEFNIEFAEAMHANNDTNAAKEVVQVGAMAARALVDLYAGKLRSCDTCGKPLDASKPSFTCLKCRREPKITRTIVGHSHRPTVPWDVGDFVVLSVADCRRGYAERSLDDARRSALFSDPSVILCVMDKKA